MSELSQEEKKRILRERRQAKMAKGQASARLNNILSQGSSVHQASAVSVLDEPKKEESEAKTTAIDHHTEEFDDPGIQDISAVEEVRNTQQPPLTEEIDKMFQNIFAGATPDNGDSAAGNDQFSQMMMNMFKNSDMPQGESSNPDAQPAQLEYQTQLAAYHAYEQRKWTFRFLLVRYTTIVSAFFYYFVNFNSFRASSLSVVRETTNYEARGFTTFILSFEIAVLSSYYLIGSSKGFLKTARENNFIFKAIGFGSAFLPQLQSYKPLIGNLLGYYALFNMLFSDFALIVVLFGLLSFMK